MDQTGNEVVASERLFLDNPTMDGAAKLAPAFVGEGPERYDLVGDHVSVLPVLPDVTMETFRLITSHFIVTFAL